MPRFAPAPGILCLLCLLLAACGREPSPGWQGYAEGEYLYVASTRPGRLLELGVRRGEEVPAGHVLFRLDPEPEATAVAEARQRVRQAEFRARDLGQGERPSELAAIDARLGQARATRDLAALELTRSEALFASGTIPRERLDRARSEAERSAAAVRELEAAAQTARLGARSNRRHAAGAEAEAAAAALAQAEWALAQKSPAAPEAALVFDTLFEPGELVPAGTPVVVLLPPAGRKARFFVPEPQLAALHPGGKVRLRFDGGELAATISYIAPQAEYTPPVIYSRDSRSKLVFLVEARPAPADAARLKPGQPLEVVPE